MNVLFTALHFGYFRNFESVIAALADRGHRVHLLAEEPERLGGQGLVARLAETHPLVSWDWAPARDDDRWLPAARKLRHGLEYVRFLESRYDRRPKVRQVSEERAPRALIALLTKPPFTSAPGRRLVAASLRHAERLMPIGRAVEALLREQSPDMLLLASLTYSRSQQIDYLKAACALGIRTVACIMGFDHLSSKAPLHILPDKVFVWNETQRQEARDLHRIPDDRIVVTGAQCYDQWFVHLPSRPKADFCRVVGLDPDRPFLLYVCSAMSPNPNEVAFVLEWLKQIRASDDPRLRGSGVLIRPHPERTKDWAGVDLSAFGNVALHGRNPVDAEAKADYFDALYHCEAVIGLVTSAFLEAGIVGRAVHTLLLPQFRAHQEGMRHFEDLMNIEGGLLIVARSFEEHLAQLVTSLDGRDGYRTRASRFLRAFIRPTGLDVPATHVFVRELEALAQGPAPRPERSSLWRRVLAPAVVRGSVAVTEGPARTWMMNPVEVREAQAVAASLHRKRLQREAKAEERRRRVVRKRRRQIVVGLKTVARRAMGLVGRLSQASGGGTQR